MISLPKDLYEKFLRFALENANPLDPSSWKECIALVLGKITGDQIEITDIVPIGSGSSVYVDITDYERVFSLIPMSKIDQGEVIVGWAHTHPGLGLFLSGTDIGTQIAYQQMHSLTFALVLDPTKISSSFPGFKIFRVSNRSVPYAVDYTFSEEFDYSTTHRNLISELYLVPEALVPSEPVAISNTEVIWNNISIQVSGEQNLKIGQLFYFELSIKVSYRQYVRLEYEIEISNNTINPFNAHMLDSIGLFHETISSGRLCIHSFRAKKAGISEIKIKNLKLIDYRGNTKKMPNLCLISHIR